MSFVDVREPHTGKLLFRYDADRKLVEIQQRNVKTVIDLTQYQQRAPKGAPNESDSPMAADGQDAVWDGNQQGGDERRAVPERRRDM